MEFKEGIIRRNFIMVGITSYGAYIPWLRINRKTISSAMGWFNPPALPGEKAVANYDEDSITMAVAAGMDCLNGLEREKIGGLHFATTTSPYKERQGAGIIATALDFHPNIRAADFTDSLKAGTTAFLSACDAVKSGTIKKIMLCASDCRMAKASSTQEQFFGDGAAALLIGDSNVIATLEGSYSISHDFMGHWREESEKFVQAWEDRWIRDEGYLKILPEAIFSLLNKYRLNIKDFAKIIYPCPYAREHADIGKMVGAEPSQLQDTMLASVGDTGTAHPLMMLVAALEEAKPGDKILVASFGNGSDVLFLQVTEEIRKLGERRGIKKHLAHRKELDNYEKYLAFSDMVPIEKGLRAKDVSYAQVSTTWRERKSIFALKGCKCKRCGTPQFPYQRICVKAGCGAIDEMEDYRFSDKGAILFTYTGDNLAFSISPPAIYGIVNFEGGGRYWFDLTDCELDSLKVGMPVEMSFRKRYNDEVLGIGTYFWKAVPKMT
jgi:3-hydroxy-3-methylglutaryl CoA synthase